MSGVRDVRPHEIPIHLDRPRSLRFDLNALATLEEEFGSIEAAMQHMDSGSIKSIRTLLWAGLLHEAEDGQPAPTQHEVGSWITLDMLPMVAEALGQAFMEAMPEKEPDSPGKFPKNSSGTRKVTKQTSKTKAGTGPGSST